MADFVQTLMTTLAVGSLYALIALGYTMVYGILKFINFAHSDIVVLGAGLVTRWQWISAGTWNRSAQSRGSAADLGCRCDSGRGDVALRPDRVRDRAVGV